MSAPGAVATSTMVPMRLAALALSFLTIVVTMVAAEFYDLYLLSWQSQLIFTDDWNLWDAAERSGTYYLPFTTFSALPYGPLFYYPMAAWMFVLDTVRVIDVDGWTQVDGLYGSVSAPALLKLPNLAVFLATAWLFRSIAPRAHGASLAMLWMLNPGVILAFFVMGQNDGWTMLLVLAAFRLAQLTAEGGARAERHAFAAMAVLGLGAAVKLQPALLFVPFALALDTRWPWRAALLAVAGVVFLAPVAPFIGDPFFRHHALFNPQGQTLLDHRIGELPLFWPMYAAAALWPLTGRGAARGLVPSLVAVHAILFVLSDWPPERAAWFAGVSIIACAYDRAGLVAYAGATVAALVVALPLGNGLGAGVFTSLSEQLAAQRGIGAAIDEWIALGTLHDGVVLAAGAGWLITLIALTRSGGAAPARVPDALLLALALALPAYFAVSIAYGGGGVSVGSASGSERQVGDAQVAQPFLSAHERLASIELAGSGVLSDATLEDARGQRHALEAETTSAGWRLRLADGGAAEGRAFVLRFDLRGGRVLVAQTGDRPPATIDGVAVPYVLAARYHFSRDWSALAGDAAANLARRWLAVLAVSAMLAPAFVSLARRGARGSAELRPPERTARPADRGTLA